ncbi:MULTISPECIES: site-specific integrase [Bacteroidales]|uniref:Site-specific integrase n=2 Tax=Bacteroidales TaxID=171549 RepID=A0A3P2ACP9_9BACE|nr:MULTISPECIES: site-specific integrase [Bacteroidales]KGL47525.1 integrase [Porphyromonas gulae]KGL49062.1 integrase [Porphyromonas cangingivalis]KGN88033.1 integrase [Porphyromonas gulae]KGO04854.1 integrase [Porphyromonas gulae]RRD92456.1 site-specific integrase [Bacteroides heparinolyticus]
MKQNFKVSFYLRSNYENKEGKSPVMLRVFLNGEMANFGSTKIFVDKSLWSNTTSRLKGRTADALTANAALDGISYTLNAIYRKFEDDETLSMDKIRSIFCGKTKEYVNFLPVFDSFIEGVKQRVGRTISKDSLQKYSVVRRHFYEFLIHKYSRKDIGLTELSPSVIQDFELYLSTVAGCSHNTTVKKMKSLKTITIYAQKRGILLHDPFLDYGFHLKPVNRDFLTDEEILKIANKDLELQRLELVRDIFIFSCFTGLAYIDVANLTPAHIVTMDNKLWIMTQRQKSGISSNILLLDIPKSIIAKYGNQTYREGKLLPILSNQKTNAYLKEIADLCGIEKNLTFHVARHTFATMSLSKGVPMESVSKMLGHTNIRTTQIYARITNKKVEHDMEQLAEKLDKFNTAMGI